MSTPCSKRSAGFSLIEVLIALVVTSVGLLGLAALQVTSMRVNHGAFLRSQATQLAHDIADRMRANRGSAISGAYDLGYDEAPATTTTVAEADLADWHSMLARELPSGDGAISVTSTGLALIEVRWNDARGDDGAENADSDGGGDADDDGVDDGDGLLVFRLATEI
jgi:type IV pilus assembly protein PilV